jgi:Reverse transcriptase (RNA-dependent DNA polymerase)/Group II intron, maturase-specific domain
MAGKVRELARTTRSPGIRRELVDLAKLSPLLSNLVLDDLDKELTGRGLRFCRYADDCNIYVRSRRAGERVMASVSRFLTDKLKLKVNEAKSAVARPEERKFLGFSISNDGSERRIAPKALAKFKAQIRDMTRRTRGNSLPQVVEDLAPYLLGWRGYFGFCQTPTSAHQPGGMDPPKATSVPLAAMAKRPQPLQRTTTAWPAKVPRGGCCRLADRFLAHVRTSGRPTGAAQPVFRRSRSSSPLRSCPRLTRSNRRGTDPYARWCGRGGAARCPPIPIFGATLSLPRVPGKVPSPSDLPTFVIVRCQPRPAQPLPGGSATIISGQRPSY